MICEGYRYRYLKDSHVENQSKVSGYQGTEISQDQMSKLYLAPEACIIFAHCSGLKNSALNAGAKSG